MTHNRSKRRKQQATTMGPLTSFITVMLLLIFIAALYIVTSLRAQNEEDPVERINKINQEIEPFKRNLTECAYQVEATEADVERFLKRIPQSNTQGKCLVACILQRNDIIKDNKIELSSLVNSKSGYGESDLVASTLKTALAECVEVVEEISEICEYASVFYNCMHNKMEHILLKTMEGRINKLGGMSDSNNEQWSEIKDDIHTLADEL